MTYVVRPAPACLAVDTVETFTEAALEAVGARGVKAVLRYATGPYAMKSEELQLVTGKGFGVGLIIASRSPGWVCSAETGAADGAAARAALTALGIPGGASILDDCETPSSTVPTADRIAHVDACAADLIADWLPGVYIGEGFGLTGAEWYARPNIRRYMKAGSRLLDPAGDIVEPHRGFCAVQGLPFNVRVGPIQVDFNLLAADYLGGTLMLVYDAMALPSA